MAGGLAGSTYSVIYLSQGLANRGHHVYLMCREGSLLHQQAAALSKTRIHLVALRYRHAFSLRLLRFVQHLLREKQIQLINAQASPDRYVTLFLRLFFKLRIPVVHTRRQKPESAKFKSWYYNLFVTRYIAVSQEIKSLLVDKGYRRDKIMVIPNGTPKEKYAFSCTDKDIVALRKKHGIGKEEKVVGCLSRLKEQRQLLEALPLLDKKVVLVFVGIEENKDFCQLRVRLAPERKVIYVGAVSNKESLMYLRWFDIKVLPSVMEGLSQALLEAMALGTPVVATAYAGNLSLIRHGKNGLLFENGDIQGLAQQIRTLLEDQTLRQTLIRAGKKTALEDFSIEKTVRRHEDFFQQLITQTTS